MEALAENWFFVVILLLCVGVHFLGHGHGHGGSHVHGKDPGSGGEGGRG